MKDESPNQKIRSDKESFISEESEKDIQEREIKMRKILDATQFTRWQKIEKERIKQHFIKFISVTKKHTKYRLLKNRITHGQ